MTPPVTSKTHWFYSLKFRIPAIYLVLFILIILSITITLNTIGKRLINEQAFLKTSAVSHTILTELEKRNAIAETLADTLASLADQLSSNTPVIKQLFAHLIAYKSTDNFIAGGGVWPAPYQLDPEKERFSFFWSSDMHGQLQFYDGYNNPEGPGYHNEEWYIPATYLQKGSTYWSKSYTGPFSLQPMVTVAVAMFRKQQRIGVATINLSLDGMQSLLHRLTQPFGGYAFIVDRNGALLSFPSDRLSSENSSRSKESNNDLKTIKQLAVQYPLFSTFIDVLDKENEKIIQLAEGQGHLIKSLPEIIATESDQIDSDEASLIAAAIDNPLKDTNNSPTVLANRFFDDDYFLQEPVYISVITMPDTLWKIITVMPYSAIIQDSVRLNNRLFNFTIAAILAALVIIWLLLNKILLAPINNLARQLRQNTVDGHLSTQQLHVNDRSEISSLTYWFNKRTEQLLESQQLLSKAHAKLEQRVQERTRELSDTNFRLEKEINAHKNTEISLLNNKARLSEAQAIAHIASWRWNLGSDTFWWSDEAYRICGLSPQKIELSRECLRNIIHPEDLPTVIQVINQAVTNKTPFYAEFRIFRPNGEIRYLHNQGEIFHPENSPSPEVVGTTIDVTERKFLEAELRLSATTFEIHEAIMITDAEANIQKINKAFTEITGYTEKDVIGKNSRILNADQQDDNFYKKMWLQLKAKGQYDGELWSKRKNGEQYPLRLTITATRDEHNEVTHFVTVFSDITDQKNAENKIRNLAFYDPLTKLSNRRLLLDRLEHELIISKRNHKFGAVLFLDLDHFKLLNDALGHTIGDELLIQVSKRLDSCLRDEDTAARLGGDEFVVMIIGRCHSAEESLDQALTVAEKIQQAIGQPYDLQGHTHHITASSGITVFPDNNFTPEEILKQADAAMYQAKSEGRNSICFYKPEMQKKADIRLKLEKELREAIEQKYLQLEYQPQVNANGQCFSVEALVRWAHKEDGYILPDIFIPVAEESGLIIPLGNWIINEACRQLNEWSSFSNKISHIAINVSPRQFRQHEFIETIENAINKYHINPRQLTLELTERVVITNIEDTVNKMQALKSMGVGISIDDFGTGYSSLTYLKQLPLNQLKIDQSFIRDINIDPNDAIIVQTIIAMANHLGLDVIAEGVENEAQKDFLLKHGCQLFQGHYFSKPLSAAAFKAYLEKN